MKIIYDKSKVEIELGDIIITNNGSSYIVCKNYYGKYILINLSNCCESQFYKANRMIINNLDGFKEILDIAKVIKHKDIVITENNNDDWLNV